LLDPDPEARSIVDPRDATASAGLSFVSDEQPGIRRQRAGKGFTFVRPNGETMRDEATLKRIRKLAIPPLDLPARGRSHPGDRPRRQGAQTISLLSAIPRGPREHKIRAHDGIRAVAAGNPR
jgi:hypothetical protein